MTAHPPSSKPVPLQDVEAELSRQLRALQPPGAPPTPRTRLANLLIFCSSQEQALQVDAMLPEIVALHPARILLLIGEPGPELTEVSASVKVQQLPATEGKHIVCEQVCLHASGAMVDRFPFAVRALLIGDLPTNLWWMAPVPPPLGGALMMELVEICQQIIYDSIGWPDPIRGVAATASWLEQVLFSSGSRWRVISDLNWRRLKYWRRLVGQALDPASAPGAATSVTELLIEHGPHAVVQGWMLASWLINRLGWQLEDGKVQPGTELIWQFSRPDGGTIQVRIHRQEEGPPQIERIRLTTQIGGTPTVLSMSQVSEHRLGSTVEGADSAPRTITLPAWSIPELLGRQLADRERDSRFLAALTIARHMAQRVLGH